MGINSLFSKTILVSAGLLYMIISFMILERWIDLTLPQLFILSYTFVLYIIVFIITNKSLSYASNAMFIVYYLVVQSVGIPVASIFNYETANRFLIREKLFYGAYLDRYLAISILAVIAIFIGIAIAKKSISQSDELECKTGLTSEKIEKRTYYYISGCTLLFLFSTFMLVNLLIGNISLSNHDMYTNWAINSRTRNYLQFGYWFGTIFVIASSTRKRLKIPIFLFSIASVILIITGNRNDVLYPLIIGLGIYIYRFKKVPKLITLFLLVFILVVSPIIASTRTTGVNLISNQNSLLELCASSFCEFGSQLTPVSCMFQWIDYGESFALGGTYAFASFAELFGSINPYYRELFANSRFDITTRLPDLGFSMPGELYFNFGFIGIIMVYLMVGVYLAKGETRLLDVDGLVRYSFTCFTLLHLVRNSFSSYISIIIIFYILYFIEKLLRNQLNSKTKININNLL